MLFFLTPEALAPQLDIHQIQIIQSFLTDDQKTEA